MVRCLREMVADDDGALEVLDALDSETREGIEAVADLETVS